ncbi:lysophospholipid acyltransferase family protein [Roseisolibacter sp. H3M3-2]|uniref:lysophospholipid acyltransferase family protein n=1 Tax=Roseisolibacter sp. H3M3-2 TaxID=3031323 RepID=UPI0023DC315F|nr:lysophospholipid acyltransferase family protein [Roseisolibacter sp. H3M3-2]MDF1504708.1 lysophospholipid acyltransferase family protein [Roseisolibacter sp. H3M3-2]
MQRLVTAWVWTLWVLIVIVGFPVISLVWAATAPFDPARYAPGRTFRWFGALGARLNPWWHFHQTGVRIRDPRRPYVVVSNHESYADIFLISHLPWEMKWLAKKTIFNIPVMGWIMRMVGDVPLVRGNRQSAVGALAMCRNRLARGASVMVFPEGTRSNTDELLSFKDGAFALAVESQVPILPIAIAGTRDAMAKHSFRVEHATAACRVLPPIATAGLGSDDVPALREYVKGIIDRARRELLAELQSGRPLPRLVPAPEPAPAALPSLAGGAR